MEGGDPENPVNYYFLLENIFSKSIWLILEKVLFDFFAK